jgi:hypothetical protein
MERRCRTSLMLSSGESGTGHAINKISNAKEQHLRASSDCQLTPCRNASIMVDQAQDAAAKREQRDAAVTDTHTTILTILTL